jgi:hypothetical protein
VEGKRDATLLPLQIAHPETREITQTDMEVQRNGAGEVEVGLLMVESKPFVSDTDSLNASQTTSPKRPKKPRVELKGSRTRNKNRRGMRATWTQV